MKIYLLLCFFFFAVFLLNIPGELMAQCSVSITAAPASAVVCAPQTVTLTAAGSGGNSPYSYHWSTLAVSPSISAPASGTYSVTVTDASFCTAVASRTVTVNPMPATAVSGLTCVCTNAAGVTYTTPNHSGNSYNWTISGGSIVTGQFTNQITVNWSGSAGSASVSVTETIPSTTCSNLNTLNVTIVSYPVATVTVVNDNSCSGTAVNFQGPAGAGYSYLWNFGDATSGGSNTSTLQNPVHIFKTYGCATTQYNVTLTVTNSCGCATTSPVQVVTIKQQPNPVLQDQDPVSPFSNCDNNPSSVAHDFLLVLNNVTTSTGCITGYSIDWGDGIVEPYLPGFTTASHTYTALGAFNLVFTATNGTNGCAKSVAYVVANQSNPAVGISAPGTTSGCSPITWPFTIIGAGNNSPGTTYRIEFGDGTSQTKTNDQLLLDSVITHTYSTSSCGQGLPGNQFIVKVTAINACDSTYALVSGVKVYQPPVATFTSSPANIGCIATPVCFTNTTANGFGANCAPTTTYAWDFGDPGSGAANTSILATPPCHSYASPGTYTITLVAGNGPCASSSTFTKTICINPQPISGFTINNTIGCNPVAVDATNTSPTPNTCGDLVYTWSVAFAASGTCTPSAGGWSFTNGSNLHSQNASFSFDDPGVYTITLGVQNSCTTAVSTKIITVKGVPKVTIAAIPPMCLQGTVNPTATFADCNGTVTGYNWTFPGGSPASATTAIPGAITYSGIGNYTITADATNECGTGTGIASLIVGPVPVPTLSGPTPVCIGAPGNVYTTEAGKSGYTWSVAGGVVTAGGGASNNTITITWNTPGVQSVSVNYLDNGCFAAAPVSFPVTVNARPVPTLAGPGSICIGTTGNVYTTEAGMTAYSWSVSAGGTITSGGTSTSNTATVSWTTAGSKTVTVNYTNANGCNALTATNYPVTVNPLPSPSISGASALCLGAPAAIYTTQTGMTSYLWTVSPGGTIASGGGPADNTVGVVWNATGPQTVTVNYTNGNGCRALSATSYSVIVSALPNPSILGPDSLCANSSGNVYITQSGMSNYLWTISGGLITAGGTPAANTATVTWTSAGSQTISVNYSQAGCPASAPVVFPVKIHPIPIASAGSDFSIPNGTSTTLNGFGSSAGTYLWTSIPPNMINLNGVLQPTTNNLYSATTFTLTVTSAKGCTNSDQVVVSLYGNPLSGSCAALPDVICNNGASVQLSATGAGGSGTYSYAWSCNQAGTPPWTSTLQNPVVAPSQNTVYTVVIDDGFNTATSNITVSVNPIPAITSPLQMQICSGENVNYTPVSDVPGTTFTWTRSSNPCIASAPALSNGSGTISNVLTNSCTTFETVNYTITPTGPAPTHCPGTPVSLAVEVIPVAAIVLTPASQTVISGQSTAAITFASNVSGTNFHWQFFSVTPPGTVTSYLPSGNTAVLPSQILSATSGGPPTCTLTYEVTAYIVLPGGKECWGTPYYYSFIIKLEPTRFNLLCPPAVCEGTPVSITLDGSEAGVEYQLLLGGFPVPGGMQAGTGSPLTWPVAQSGLYTILATNVSNGLSVLMTGQCTVTINPLPVSNYVIGSTGNCPGDIITLNGSEAGVLYELYNGAVNTLISRMGPGALDFGPQANPGTYTIKATNVLTGCWVWIDGSVIIASLPQQFLFAPAGPLCSGDSFWLAGSQPGILYSLVCTPTVGPPFTQGPFMGTGSAIAFGAQFTPGVYRVLAYNPLTGCDVYMADEKLIWPNPVPYNITPSGTHCGLTQIGLDNSETGFTYQVYKIDPATGNPYVLPDPGFTLQTGISGQALIFGSTSVPWTYCVIGYDPNNICRTQMSGLVTVLASPTKYQMLPTGTLCFDQGAGVEILLEHSDPGIEYTLFLGSIPWSQPMAGIGGAGPLSFGFITVAGTYTISAVNTTTLCTETMTGSVTLEIEPVHFTLNPQGESCPGAEIWLSGSQAGVNYTLHPPSGANVTLAGSGSMLSWGPKYQPGTYYVTAQSTVTSCHDTMTGVVKINPMAGVFNIRPQGVSCEAQDIGLENSEANTTYEVVHADGSPLIPPLTHTTATSGSFWFNSPQPWGVYRVKAITSKGCDTLMDGLVTIDPRPIADAGPSGMTICNLPPYTVDLSGTASHYSSVLWTSPTNPSGSNFSSPATLSTTYTFTPADITSKQVVLTLTVLGTLGCASTQASDQITIDILVPFVSAGADQSVCDGQNVQLAGSITGGSTSGSWTGGLGTFIPNRQTLSAIYDPDPSETGTIVTLTLTADNTTLCPDVSDQVSITVFNTLAPATAQASQSLCYGQAAQTLWATSPSGGSGVFTMQWQQFIVGVWTDITGATGLSYSPGPLTATSQYRLVQTDTWCNPDHIVITNAVTITVYNLLSSGAATSPQSICYGQSPAALQATSPLGGSGSFSYQWQMQTMAGPWNNIPGATTLSYSPPVLTQTTTYRVVQTDSWCTPAQVVYTGDVTITVYGEFLPGTASAGQSVCYGQSPQPLTSTPPAAGSGSFIYQWQQSTTAGVWSNIPGANTLNFTPPALFVTTHYRLEQTDAYCTPAQVVYTNQVTVIVYGELLPGTATSDQTICYGQVPTALQGTAPTGGSLSLGYQWQSRTGAGPWTDIAGAVLLVYQPPALTQTTSYRLVETDPWCSPPQVVYTNQVTITVHGEFLPGTAGPAQTICFAQTPQPLISTVPSGGAGNFTYQWQLSTTSGVWNNIPGATTLGYSPGALNVTTLYRLVQTDTYCTPDQVVYTGEVTITVYGEFLPGIVTASQSICYGQAPQPLVCSAPAGGSGNFSYQWQLSTTAGVWNNIPGANTLGYSPGVLTVSTSYRLVQTDAYCGPAQVVYTGGVMITVYGEFLPGTASADESVCYGQAPQPLVGTAPAGGSQGSNFTYQWQMSTTAGVWTSIAGANTLACSPGAMSVTTLYRLEQTDPWCSPARVVYTNEVTITVYGEFFPGTATTDQAICRSQVPAALQATAPAGGSAAGNFVYQWQLSTTAGVWNNIPGANTLGYSPGPLYVTTLYRLQQADPWCTPGQVVYTNVVTITVYGEFTPGTATADQWICQGQIPQPLSSTAPLGGSGAGNFSYQWQLSTTAGVWNNIPGANTLGYAPAALNVTTMYRLVQTDPWCTPVQVVYTNALTITVYGEFLPGTATAAQAICYGQIPAPLICTAPGAGSGSGNFLYQWQLSTTAGVWNNIPGANTLNFSPPALFVTTLYRLVQTDSYCTPVQVVYTNEVTITVYGEFLPGSASADQVICRTETPDGLFSTAPTGGSGSGNFAYQWQLSTTAGVWNNIPGANTLAYSPGALLVSTMYRLVQTDMYCTPDQVVYTNAVTITVHGELLPGTATAGQVLCYGQAPASLLATPPSGGSGNFTYQWQVSTTAGTWNNIPGANTLGYSPLPLSVTTHYRLEQTDTYCTPDQVVHTNEVTITVYGEFLPGTATFSQGLCYGQIPAALQATAPSGGSGAGGFTYQWQLSTTAGVWNNIPGANTLNFSPPALFVTTLYRLQQTDAYCTPAQVVYTNEVTITVYGQLTPGTATADQSICHGQTPAPLTVSAPTGGSGSGHLICQWQVSTIAGVWDNIFGATALSYQPPSLLQTTSYRNVQTDVFCTPDQVVTTNQVTITVHGELLPGSATSDQTICYGETPAALSALAPTGGSGSINFIYQWQQKTGTGPWNNITGANMLAYSPGALSVTTFYRLVQTDSWCIPAQVVYTNQVTITVHPELQSGTASSDQMVCYGQVPQALGSTPPGGGSGLSSFTYQWQSRVGAGPWTGIAGANALIYSPPALVSTTIYRLEQTDTYCTPDQVVYTNEVTITVTGEFLPGTAGSDQMICYGAVPAALLATAPSAGSGMSNFTYQWQRRTSPTGVWNNVPGQTALVYQPSSLTRTTWYRLQQTDVYCTPDQVVYTNTVVVTIDLPVVDFQADTACLGSATSFADLSVSISGQIASHHWDFGDGTTSNLANPQHTYLATGSYPVTLQVVSAIGCIKDTTKTVLVRPLPFAAFTTEDPRCAGSAVTFTDHSTTTASPICKAYWQFGDGSVQQVFYPIGSQVVTHTFTNAGTYPVTLTVTTTDSCKRTVTHAVAVYHKPAASFYADNILCKNTPVQFHDLTQMGGGLALQSWHWNFGDPQSGVNDTSTYQNPWHSFSGSGSFIVTMIVTNMAGCQDTFIDTLSINTLPVSNFASDTVCLGSVTTFTDLSTSTPGTIVGHLWDFGDGQTATTSSPTTHLYGSAGTYNVKLTVTSNSGCKKDTIKPVLVLGAPVSAFSFSSPACAGDSVQFTDLSTTPHGSIVDWTWDFGDGTVIGPITYPASPNIRHKYTSGGTYNVKLTIHTSDGCMAMHINAISISFHPLANFSFASNACAHTALQFTDLSQLNGGPSLTSWAWNFGDPASGVNNTSTVQNPMHSFSAGTSYTVRLMVTNANGCTDSLPGGKPVTVNAAPVASFTVDSSCIMSPTQFTDASTTPSGTIQVWAWNFGDPASGLNNTSSLENPSHIFATAGTYWVTLQVTNSSQCVKDTSIMVITNPRPLADFQSSVACQGSPTQFTDLSIAPNSTVKSWAWDFGDGTTAAIQNPSHTYAGAGTFGVTLIVTNLYNCTDTVTKPVVVHYKPLSDFTFHSFFCPANRVDFQDSSRGYGGAFIQGRTWLFEPGYTAINTVNPTHYFTVSDTTYDVTLMVTDNYGCKDTVVNSVFVLPGYDLGFTYDTACFGSATHFRSFNRAQGDTLYTPRWDFGDPDSGPQNYSTELEPEHRFTRTGTFLVWLKAWNSDNCADSVYRMVRVFRGTGPDFVFQGTVCNDTVRFQDKSTAGFGTITRREWLWDDGTAPVVILPPDNGDTLHAFTQAGTYGVKLVVTNSLGCTDSIVKDVSVTCISAGFTLSGSGGVSCSADSLEFHDISSPVSKIGSWHWDFGDTKTLDYTTYRSKVKHKFAPGTFTVSLTVSTPGAAAVTAVYSLGVSVGSSPVADFSNEAVCRGDSARFFDLALDNQVLITTRQWKFGDGTTVLYTDTLVNPVHKYKNEGVYNARFRVTNIQGCSDSVEKQVVVHHLPVALFTSTAPCQRYDIVFSDGSLAGDTTIKKWWWNFGDPQHPYDTLRTRQVVRRFDSLGVYPVYLRVSDAYGCTDDTVYAGFAVKASPIAAFTITENVGGKPGRIRLNNESVGSKDKAYRWDYATGTSTEQSPVITYVNDNQVYRIELVTWNESDCYDTTWINYEFKFDNLFVPNAFSPANTVLGVREFKPRGMNLQDYHVMIFDKWGHLLWESILLTDDGKGMPAQGWDGTFNGQAMPQDVYMWKISATFKDGKVWEGSDTGKGSTTTMGTVTLIR